MPAIGMNILKALRNWLRQQDGGYRGRDFGVAMGLVGIATLVNLLAWPSGSDQDGHYFALVAAVLLSALYGGLGPGLFATAVAGLSSAYFTLSPQFSLRVADPNATIRLVVFLVEGVLLSLAAHFIRNHHKTEIPRIGLAQIPCDSDCCRFGHCGEDHFSGRGPELPFAFNYAAICVCAWTGGILPGILATVLLAGLTRYLFLEPVHSLSVASEQTRSESLCLWQRGCSLLSWETLMRS